MVNKFTDLIRNSIDDTLCNENPVKRKSKITNIAWEIVLDQFLLLHDLLLNCHALFDIEGVYVIFHHSSKRKHNYYSSSEPSSSSSIPSAASTVNVGS